MASPKFTLPEFTGSLADLGTIIPFILIAVSVTGMKLGPILLAFGLFYVVSGLIYRLPVAVEPLKAVGAIAVSSSLTQGEIVGAGIFVGLFFLLLGVTGLIDKIAKVFPISLIRGVQLGLALVLLVKGGQYIMGDLYLGLLAVGLFVFARFVNRRHSNLNFPGALLVFIIGIAYGFYVYGVPPVQLSIPLDIYLPTAGDLVKGAYKAGIAQLPLTLTNAILATSLLASDLFREKVSNRRLSTTIGGACVVAPLLGGFPMCHGAGGMAAHYQFGARTGGADVMIGALFIALSFVATSPMLALVPAGVLGTLLFLAGWEMLRNAVRTDRMLVTAAAGVVMLLVDPTVGLGAGIAMFLLSKLFRPEGLPSPWYKQ
ncbi:putative sulfate/molybdate transporter [Methanocella sp. MCL-LM]|uniref:putative sulfate/molybdate transporter n=1 Tax=Methanocella sp. MCL-LM TaxID=3412035 RepID=UPI003C7784C1